MHTLLVLVATFGQFTVSPGFTVSKGPQFAVEPAPPVPAPPAIVIAQAEPETHHRAPKADSTCHCPPDLADRITKLEAELSSLKATLPPKPYQPTLPTAAAPAPATYTAPYGYVGSYLYYSAGGCSTDAYRRTTCSSTGQPTGCRRGLFGRLRPVR